MGAYVHLWGLAELFLKGEIFQTKVEVKIKTQLYVQ